MHGFGIGLVTLAEDFNLIRNHKRTVKSQSKVPDDSFRFILVLA